MKIKITQFSKMFLRDVIFAKYQLEIELIDIHKHISVIYYGNFYLETHCASVLRRYSF